MSMFSDEVNSFKPLQRAEYEEAPEPRKTVDISLFNIGELFSLRARIDAMLPAMELKSMNLEMELVIQHAVTKHLQQEVIDDGNIEKNKKSMVVNSCTKALETLTKLQNDVYTSERFKTVEGLLIRYMKTLPKETVDAFLAEYKGLTNG